MNPESTSLKPANTAPFSIDALAERLVRFHKHKGLELFIEWKEDVA